MTNKLTTGTENLAGHTIDGSESLQAKFARETREAALGVQLKNEFGTSQVKPNPDGTSTVILPFQKAHANDRPDTDSSSMRGYMAPLTLPAAKAAQYVA